MIIKRLQEHLAFIQLQGGNNPLLEKLMSLSLNNLKKNSLNIWHRNSYYFHAHHPLASDIDVTYVGNITEAQKLFHKMKKNKLFGELNFYPNEILEDLIILINPFELARDPLLEKKFPEKKKTPIQKQVFLARHIIGDAFWLIANPKIRTKKWNYILEIINEKIPSLSLDNLLALTSNPEAISFYLQNADQNLFEVFKNSPYRSIFPQKHIWEEKDLTLLKELSVEAREFFLEQVKWEFWGIGTQLHWIDLKISYEFLERLRRMATLLEIDAEEAQAMDNVLSFMGQQYPSNR